MDVAFGVQRRDLEEPVLSMAHTMDYGEFQDKLLD
jgi:hypothetical protein